MRWRCESWGIAILVPGLGLLLDSLLLKFGYFDVTDTHPAYFLIYGSAQVVVALYLIRGAPSLVRFAYATEDEDEVGAEEK